jgi:hypothetical protein
MDFTACTDLMGRATECMEICRQKWGTARTAETLTVTSRGVAERAYRMFLNSTDLMKGDRRNRKKYK